MELVDQTVELGGNVTLLKLVELLDVQLQGIQSEMPLGRNLQLTRPYAGINAHMVETNCLLSLPSR